MIMEIDCRAAVTMAFEDFLEAWLCVKVIRKLGQFRTDVLDFIRGRSYVEPGT